jgi:hypothetical protein
MRLCSRSASYSSGSTPARRREPRVVPAVPAVVLFRCARVGAKPGPGEAAGEPVAALAYAE